MQRLDDRDAAPAFVTIAARRPSGLDRIQQIFENPLMPARVADDQPDAAWAFWSPSWAAIAADFGRRVAHVAADDPILLDAHGPARARHLDPPRIPGYAAVVASSVPIAPLANSSQPTIVIFDFDLVNQRAGSGRRRARCRRATTAQKVDGVNALIPSGRRRRRASECRAISAARTSSGGRYR